MALRTWTPSFFTNTIHVFSHVFSSTEFPQNARFYCVTYGTTYHEVLYRLQLKLSDLLHRFNRKLQGYWYTAKSKATSLSNRHNYVHTQCRTTCKKHLDENGQPFTANYCFKHADLSVCVIVCVTVCPYKIFHDKPTTPSISRESVVSVI